MSNASFNSLSANSELIGQSSMNSLIVNNELVGSAAIQSLLVGTETVGSITTNTITINGSNGNGSTATLTSNNGMLYNNNSVAGSNAVIETARNILPGLTPSSVYLNPYMEQNYLIRIDATYDSNSTVYTFTASNGATPAPNVYLQSPGTITINNIIPNGSGSTVVGSSGTTTASTSPINPINVVVPLAIPYAKGYSVQLEQYIPVNTISNGGQGFAIENLTIDGFNSTLSAIALIASVITGISVNNTNGQQTIGPVTYTQPFTIYIQVTVSGI